MFRFTPYVIKSVLRHRARTLLTVSGAAVAIFVFCFVGAVRNGLERLTDDPESQRRLIVYQINRFCPFTSRMPEDYHYAMSKMSGVRDVLPILVFMNNCRASLDLVVFHGVPPAKLKSFRDITVTAGAWDDFEHHRDSALVGQALARRRGLSVGDRFSVGDVTVTVAAIYSAPSPSEENFLYTHLEFLQRTRGLNMLGTVTQFEVQLADGADPDAACQAIDARFRGGPIQTDTRPKGVFEASAVEDLAELIGFAAHLGFACVGLVLMLVATTTVMAVQDRVREHALLQTLGFPGPLLFRLIVTESLLVSLAGGVLGIGAAFAALWWSGLTVGTEGVSIAFLPSASLALTALGITAAVGMLAGLVPAWQAARAEIVASLRSI
jgi:putative ABC transport system permease protein